MARTRAPVALTALRDCLRFLLTDPSSSAWPLPVAVLPDDFLDAARRHKVVPLLRTALASLSLPDGLAADLRAEGDVDRMRCLRQATELARLFTVLGSAAVPTLAFKGLALADQAYGDFAARGVGDHDVLVRPADLPQARAALLAAGWTLSDGYPQPDDGWAWQFLVRNGYEMEFRSATSVVDLHWRLDPTLAALPGFDELWDRRSSFDIAGTPVARLSARDALAHSCSNAAKDDWRWLRSLVDVARLGQQPASWSGLTPRGLRPVQLQTVGVAAELLGWTGLPEGVRRPALAAARRPVRTAQRRQAALLEGRSRRYPGLAAANTVRRRSRGSHRMADLRRVVLSVLAPPEDLAHVANLHAGAATLAVTKRRAARLRVRVREWWTR